MATPLEPLTPAPRVPVHVAAVRFVVRSLCDDKGQPDTVLIVMYPWLTFAGAFFYAALHAPSAVIDAEVSRQAVEAVLLVTLALVLWAAALKLGAGVFVPLATAVAGAFQRAAGGVMEGVRRYHGGPDRSVGLTDPGGELYRLGPVHAGGDDPLADDETDGRA